MSTPSQIDLYWRPGCGFCSSLRRQLDKIGLDTVDHNIWEDAEAAAVVRRHANGNETVPTVVIGETGLVNPSARELLAVLEAEAPHLVPEGVEQPESGRIGGFVNRLLNT